MEYEQFQKLLTQVKSLEETDDAKEFFQQTREALGEALDWRAGEEYAGDACDHFFRLVPQYPAHILERFSKEIRREHEDVFAITRQMRDAHDYESMLVTVVLMTQMELVIQHRGKSRWRRWFWRWRRPTGDALMNQAFTSLEYQEQLVAFLCLWQLANGKLADRLEHLSDYFRNRCLALALALREVILYHEEDEEEV